jgi:hypothetical protein
VGGGDKSKGAPRDFSACTRFQGPVTRALFAGNKASRGDYGFRDDFADH